MKISKFKLSCAMLEAGVDSAKQLAELSGLSVNTISRINSGNAATVATVRKIANTLQVDPLVILAEEAPTNEAG